jgi:hypothetical protein
MTYLRYKRQIAVLLNFLLSYSSQYLMLFTLIYSEMVKISDILKKTWIWKRYSLFLVSDIYQNCSQILVAIPIICTPIKII